MESNEKKYSRDGMKEGDPGKINPQEHGRTAPGKEVSERDRLISKESELGHQSVQDPHTENLDQADFQIDKDTKDMKEDSAKAAEKGLN